MHQCMITKFLLCVGWSMQCSRHLSVTCQRTNQTLHTHRLAVEEWSIFSPLSLFVVETSTGYNLVHNLIQRRACCYSAPALLVIMLDEENIAPVANSKSTKAKNGKKGRTIEETYQKKSQLEHILLRPDSYIGSVERFSQLMWVYDSENEEMVPRNISYVSLLHAMVKKAQFLCCQMTGSWIVQDI